MDYTHIIWDWNGTLLDDVAWCIIQINTMLSKRGLPTLNSTQSYHRVFGFPVKDYYQRAGFDFKKESFETLAVEFIELYHNNDNSCLLHSDAEKTLESFQRKGVHQVILSASESKNLLSQIKQFDIDFYFDEILGISNIYADNKIDIGKAYIERVKPDQAVLIGDTTHDKEVADVLGIACILVASGHQDKQDLLSCGATVVDCLTDLPVAL